MSQIAPNASGIEKIAGEVKGKGAVEFPSTATHIGGERIVRTIGAG